MMKEPKDIQIGDVVEWVFEGHAEVGEAIWRRVVPGSQYTMVKLADGSNKAIPDNMVTRIVKALPIAGKSESSPVPKLEPTAKATQLVVTQPKDRIYTCKQCGHEVNVRGSQTPQDVMRSHRFRDCPIKVVYSHGRRQAVPQTTPENATPEPTSSLKLTRPYHRKDTIAPSKEPEQPATSPDVIGAALLSLGRVVSELQRMGVIVVISVSSNTKAETLEGHQR